MPQNIQGIAGGSQIPPQQPQQQGTQIAPGNAQTANLQQALPVLEQVLSQSIDQNGYIDMTKVASLWPRAAFDAQLNLPFGMNCSVGVVMNRVPSSSYSSASIPYSFSLALTVSLSSSG